MNSFEQHPDSELLDRLRAGLFDDQPQLRARLEQHLQQCPECRRAHNWPGNLLDSGTLPDAQLDTLRRQALAHPAAHWQHRLLPFAAAAALALAAVGLISYLPSPDSPPAPQVAVSEQGNVPELYEDLDFYLWLADHKGSDDSST
jgi:hypothetical protein